MSQSQPDTTHFKVNQQTGEAFISTHKAAELLGVSLDTLKENIAIKHPQCVDEEWLPSDVYATILLHYAYYADVVTLNARRAGKTVLQLGMEQLFPTLATQ